MQFNSYNMYSYNANASQCQILDEVDEYKQNVMRMTEYEDVKSFIQIKFGEFEGKKIVAFPKLDKHIYLYIDDKRVEFCTLKNKKQYFGRGWRLKEDNNA